MTITANVPAPRLTSENQWIRRRAEREQVWGYCARVYGLRKNPGLLSASDARSVTDGHTRRRSLSAPLNDYAESSRKMRIVDRSSEDFASLIGEFMGHAEYRFRTRGIKDESALDALVNPVKTGGAEYNNQGSLSVQYQSVVGTMVVLNPEVDKNIFIFKRSGSRHGRKRKQ